MHISEGVLSAPILITGVPVCVAGVGIGLKKMDYDKLPRVAVLASTFFLASLIHVPMGPASVHMVLNGVTGLLLGWAAFPAIMIAVALQADGWMEIFKLALIWIMVLIASACVCFLVANEARRRGLPVWNRGDS